MPGGIPSICNRPRDALHGSNQLCFQQRTQFCGKLAADVMSILIEDHSVLDGHTCFFLAKLVRKVDEMDVRHTLCGLAFRLKNSRDQRCFPAQHTGVFGIPGMKRGTFKTSWNIEIR